MTRLVSNRFKIIKFESYEGWLKYRIKGIGGSDASAALGLNPYKTSVELYKEKKGLVPKEKAEEEEKRISENERVIYGKNVEDAIRKIFTYDYLKYLKVYNTSNCILIRNDKEYMFGSLDGALEVKEDFEIVSYYKPENVEDIPEPIALKKGMKGVLEIKTAEILSSMHKEKWNNKIPNNYYAQILHYLNVTGWDFVILRVQLTYEDKYKIKTHSTRDYVFLRDNVLEDLKYEESEIDKFWVEYYLKDIEPPLKINL